MFCKRKFKEEMKLFLYAEFLPQMDKRGMKRSINTVFLFNFHLLKKKWRKSSAKVHSLLLYAFLFHSRRREFKIQFNLFHNTFLNLLQSVKWLYSLTTLFPQLCCIAMLFFHYFFNWMNMKWNVRDRQHKNWKYWK